VGSQYARIPVHVFDQDIYLAAGGEEATMTDAAAGITQGQCA